MLMLSLGTTVYLAFQNYQLRQQVLQKQLTPTQKLTITSTPTNVQDSNWIAHKIEAIDLQFKVPQQITEMGNFKEEIFPGEKSDVLSAAFIEYDVGAFFIFGTSSIDYEKGKMAGFGDLQGYEFQEGKYYAKLRGEKIEIPSNLVEEITNPNGIKILKVTGKNSTEGIWQDPIDGTPGDGWVGALININNNPKYLGIAVYMELKDNLTPELFSQILSSIKFINQ